MFQTTLFGGKIKIKQRPNMSEVMKRKWKDSEYRKKFLGPKCHFWKGGVTFEENYKKKRQARWYKQNREKVINQSLKWQRENKEKRKIQNREYVKKRRRTIPRVRLNHNISKAIHDLLRSRQKSSHWEDLVGYTIQDLIVHLEKQFDEKMNWGNYGSYWVIDHILPITLFKFDSSNDPQFKQCWDLKNLRPLEKIANIKKGKRVK